MNLNDKTMVVTGANSGIGKETAAGLAKQGAQVVMICRDRQRGEAAQAEIIQESGNEQVDLLLADLSSQASIKDAARAYRERYGRLDVLVNNAGGFFMKRELTVDGLEKTFALDHLGYFLLTNLLLDLIIDSAPSRIVNVSSGAHMNAQLDFDDLQNENSYSGMKAYGQAKLANIYFTYELARRLAETRVTVNALHPGFVATNLAANNGFLAKAAMKLLGPIFGTSPKKGAETPIYLASSAGVAGISGKYFVNCQAVPSSPISYDEQIAQRLWAVSESITRTNKPQI